MIFLKVKLLFIYFKKIIRRTHQKALESMQVSLDGEIKGKNEALKLKKKLEADINELEVQLDHTNRNGGELQKNVKRLQQLVDVR